MQGCVSLAVLHEEEAGCLVVDEAGLAGGVLRIAIEGGDQVEKGVTSGGDRVQQRWLPRRASYGVGGWLPVEE